MIYALQLESKGRELSVEAAESELFGPEGFAGVEVLVSARPLSGTNTTRPEKEVLAGVLA